MSGLNFNAAPPSADSADNAEASDVIGNKTDTTAGNSLVSHARRINEGGHAIELFPSGAAGDTCTAGAAWVDGAWAEIDDGTGVPANPFKIVGICIDTPSAAFVGEIAVGYGAVASETEIARVGVEVATDVAGYLPIILPPSGAIAASTRIAALFATAAGGTTVGVKLMVQEI